MEAFYRHMRATSLQKDYTLCGVLSTKNTILVGLSVVHPGDDTHKADTFCKATGRELSLSNAHLNPVAELVIQEGDSAEYTFYSFASKFMPKQSFHRQIMNIARENVAFVVE